MNVSRDLTQAAGGVRVGDLSALLARVEAGGPDRELDAAICAALRYLPPDCREAWAIGWEGEWRPGPGNVYLLTADGKSGASFKSAPLTASLDAALALCERVLPGWRVYQIEETDRRMWFVSLTEGKPSLATRHVQSRTMPSRALAVLAALLKAKIAEAADTAEPQASPGRDLYTCLTQEGEARDRSRGQAGDTGGDR